MSHLTNIRKRTAIILSCAALGFSPAFISCESDVIDLEPVDKFSEISAYSSPDRCELSVIGAYDAAQNSRYTPNGSYERGYPLGSASILQGEMRGDDMVSTATFFDKTYTAIYTVTTPNNTALWEASFEAISRYNTVIKGIQGAIDGGVLTEEQGHAYIGECLFLRALTYHVLAIHYALPYGMEGNNNYGLPIYTQPVNNTSDIEAQLKIGLSTVEETYAQILADLNQAEEYLPEVNSTDRIGRASKGAAIALKTRIYLHMRDWNNVIAEADKLEGGIYELESDPSTPFTAYSDNKESIFSIANSSSDNPGVNGALAHMISAREGGRTLCTTSPIIYNSAYWLPDDKRRALLMYRSSDDYYFEDKYGDPQVDDAYSPHLRYAEVLLNKAEAELRIGNKQEALDLLNQVRNRSLASPETQAYQASDFADTKALLEALLWERRIEFHGEGRRWEDIHRLANDDICPSGGIPAKINYNNSKNQGAFVINGEIKPEWYDASAVFIPYTDRRFIWPIPQDDLLRNPTLAAQQNEGW